MNQKTVAIMQPYLFPYIGYFQLIQASDVFVFYDDVNYIKQGWINRNKILQVDHEVMFTVPLEKPSSNKLIKDTLINNNLFEKWKEKFIRSLEQSYSKAPYYQEVKFLIENVLNSKHKTISEFAIQSIIDIAKYLEIKKEFMTSSADFPHTIQFNRSKRIVEIVKRLDASHYINVESGQSLYSKEYFQDESLTLLFLKPEVVSYKQPCKQFFPYLSIIDILMFNSKSEVLSQFNKYQLL